MRSLDHEPWGTVYARIMIAGKKGTYDIKSIQEMVYLKMHLTALSSAAVPPFPKKWMSSTIVKRTADATRICWFANGREWCTDMILIKLTCGLPFSVTTITCTTSL
jgi:hypothetical protein